MLGSRRKERVIDVFGGELLLAVMYVYGGCILQDGQGRFEYRPKSPPTPTSRHWDYEKLQQRSKSAKLFVPHASTIDVPDEDVLATTNVDLGFFSAHGITIPTSPASPTNEEKGVHVRTNSFDLHDIKSCNKRAWRSVSAQPNMEDSSDTAPLVDRSDGKSSLRRKGCVKRLSSKSMKSEALSTSEGARDIKSLYKHKSTTDISKIGTSKMDNTDYRPTRHYQVDAKKPSFNKRPGHWVSMMDGYQRILLFTPHFHVVQNCDKASKFTFDMMELNLTLSSITVSLIDNNTNREVLLLSVQP